METLADFLTLEGILCGGILILVFIGGLGFSLFLWLFKKFVLPSGVKTAKEVWDTAKEIWEEDQD